MNIIMVNNEKEKKRKRFSQICPVEDEWLDWYRLTPRQRWKETEKLWAFFIKMGGSLDPEPDRKIQS